jgi:hypothetical protein
MTKPIRAFIAAFALMSGVVACKGDSAKQDTTGLSSDLALAGGDSSARPTLTDVPATTPPPAPKAAAPRPPAPAAKTPPRPAPTNNAPATKAPAGASTGTVGAGTVMNLASSSNVCTDTHKVGDVVTATTTETINGTNGASIPAGSVVTLEVERLKRIDNAGDNLVVDFRVVSVRAGGRTYAINGSVTEKDITKIRDQPKDKDVQKVVGGAVVGAIAGKILGGSTKATVGGAAAGAAAGVATAAATTNYKGCVNTGSRIVVRLDGPIEIRV